MKNISREKEILQLIQYKLLIYKNLSRNNRSFYTFEELCEELDLSAEELTYFINKINNTNNQTIPVHKRGNKLKICYSKKEYKVHDFHIPKKTYKIGFISDKHIGHKNDRIRYVHNVYEEGDKRGVDLYFDTGDLLNGPRELAKYAENVRIGDLEESITEANLFHNSNKPTYFITGNHDLGFLLTDYCDVGRAIEEECDNLHFLNNLFAPITVNGLRFNMSHGYIEQKYLCNIKHNKEFRFLTTNDPHLIVQGHFHTHNLSDQDNIILYQIPSLRFGDAHLQNCKKSNDLRRNSIGAIFLTVHEFGNNLELRFDEMHFVEKNIVTKGAEYTKKR